MVGVVKVAEGFGGVPKPKIATRFDRWLVFHWKNSRGYWGQM